MNFRTEIQLGEAPFKIGYNHRVLLMGSCFSDNIGDKMKEGRMKVLSNPFGISFNPYSIAQNISRIIEKNPYFESDLRERNSLFFSYDVHSSFSSFDPKKVLDNLNQVLEKTHEELKKSDVLFITFGSAWVYKHTEENKIVSNCHKVPNKYFSKELLSIEAIVGRYVQLLSQLTQFNPRLKVVFTVSPVRHLKDGFIENQRSKAILLEAVHRLGELNSSCFYFPSYEIVLDDLRDYRFFKKDMLHLNDIGIDYVWEKFTSYYFEKETLDIQLEVQSVHSFMKHQALNDESLEGKQKLALEQLKNKYPFLQ